MIMKKKDGQLAKIQKNHPSKKWGQFKEIGLTDKRHGSGRRRTVSKEEKMDLIEELVYSHEEQSHTLLAPK